MTGILTPTSSRPGADRRRLWQGLALFALLLCARSALAAFTITSTASTVFFTHYSANPQCNYRSFNVTSTTAVTDLWARIDNFTSNLSNGGSDDGKFHFGPFTAGQTKAAYFYVCSSYSGGATVTGQGFDVKLWDRDPSLAGATQQGSTFASSFSINDNVIQAAANKVTVIFSGPNPAALGGLMTMTIEGDTGTLGCTDPTSCTGSSAGGPFSYSPATFSSWRADAYELVSSNITLSGSANAGVYYDTLWLSNLATSSDTHYLATFYFRAATTTPVTTTLSPVGFISSGTQIKHTNLSSGAYSGTGLLPIEPASNTLTMAKLVSASTLTAQGGRVTYTVRITNSGSVATTLDSIYDDLPGGATYVTGSASYNGAALPDPFVSGSTRIWSGSFSVPGNSSRDLLFQADLTTPGTYTNSVTGRIGSTVIDSTLSTSDNAPATATTTVLAAPTLTKVFAPTAVAINGTSQMTLTLRNPNTAATLSGIAISDTYPAGLINATPSAVATTCAGATPITASNSLAISGVSLAAGASCTVTVNVTSTSAGTYNNTTGTISSSNGGTGSIASASVIFTTLPTITKAFGAATIPRSGSTSLTLTLTNNGVVGITGVAMTDLFPAGLVLASPVNLSPVSPCGGSLQSWNGTTASALVAGAGGISLSGGAIATPGASCTFSVDVTSATAGTYNNTTSGVNSSLGSTGPVSNTASVVVLAPPTGTKAFSPATIGRGQNSTLTITLTNPNAVAITGAAFTDTYPANLLNATTPAGATTCSGGSVTAASGGGSVALAGATIPASGSCTVTVTVTSNTVASYTNTLAAGAVTTTNTPASTGAISGVLVVNATPTITKSFTVDPTGITTTMTLVITNNHTAGISGLSFSDTFPAGMAVDTTPTFTNSCGGTPAGNTAGSTVLSLSGGAIAGASPATCTLTVRVRINSGGVFNNQTTGVTLTTPFAGTGSVSNVATLIAPILTKSFSPNTVGPNDLTRMSIQITNPSLTTALSGLAVTDSYPVGTWPDGSTNAVNMVNAPTPNLSNGCGGTVTATAGASSLTFTGGALAAGASCIIAVDVRANPALTTGNPAITYYNVTGRIRSNQGIGPTGADALYVVAKPTVTKSFLQNPVTLTGSAQTDLFITLENNLAAALSGVSITDAFPSLPAQMKYVSTVSNTCNGTLTDHLGAALVANTSNGIRLNGGTMAASSTCTIRVIISVPADGQYPNTTTGVTSTTLGATPGPTSNTSILISNLTAPTTAKSFAASQVAVNGNVTMTITLTNPNTAAITGLALTDTYPGTMVNATTPGLTSTCGGSTTAAAGTNNLVLSAGTIAASSSCTITVAVTATSPGALTNSTGAVTAGNAVTGSAASAGVTFYSAPALTKSFSAATYGIGMQGNLLLTLTNPAANPGALGTIQVSDDLSLTSMAIASTTITFTPAACGTVTKSTGAALAVNDTNIRFNVTSLAAGVSCQASIPVTVSTVGSFTNTTGTPGALTPGSVSVTGSVASANFSVVQPSLTKGWSSASITAGTNTSLVFTLTNGSGNPAQAGAAFTESLPSSLRFTATPTVTFGAGCSGSSSVSTGTPDTIALSSVAMAGSTASCTITVASVTNRANQTNSSCASTPAAFTNSSGNISGLNRLTNSVTNQCLVVIGLPSLTLTKSVMVFQDPFNLTTNPKSIPGAIAAYTLRLTNSGPGAVDNNTVIISDNLPADVDLYVGDIGVAGTGPVVFTDGTTSSGLAWNFIAIGNLTDSVEFSQNGTLWTYVPAPDVSGFDSTIRYIRLKPTGTMNAAGAGNPFADFLFRVRVR